MKASCFYKQGVFIFFTKKNDYVFRHPSKIKDLEHYWLPFSIHEILSFM